MDLKEGKVKVLEHKYNNIEVRLSKVESCLRLAGKKRQLLHKFIEESKKETSSQHPLGQLGD